MENKNKVRFFGIFGKVFFYTCLILVFVIGVFFALFYEQIHSTVTLTQQQQLSDVFQPLIESLQNKTDEEITEIAEAFHTENRSFHFCVENADGSILYQTDGFTKPDIDLPPGGEVFSNSSFEQGRYRFSTLGKRAGNSVFLALAINDKRVYVSGFPLASSVYNEILGDLLLAFSLVFIISLIAAAAFAQRISKPIRKLTANTRMMAEFEDAPDFPNRRDEIGQLAKDVYLMYQNLKDTIGQLEDEIRREREMEENQRYFFSAASHELKTPIAASSAILEGMTEGVIEPEEYPQYLQETLRLMKDQSNLVTEILDIVKMNNRMTVPIFEEVKISRLINSTLECFHPLLEAKEQVLLFDVDECLLIRSDPRLLNKALANILQNATQNSPQWAVIHIITEKKNGNCILSVENGGANIAAENLSKMFEPFYVAEESRSTQKGRNGLGLTIVKKILDLLEIPFELQNIEDGVRFTMTLPCSR